jgi:ribosomal protein S15
VVAAVWTVRIKNLERHMATHKKDVHNRRSYRKLVHKRAKMLQYLKRKSLERYYTCLKELELTVDMVEGEIVV